MEGPLTLLVPVMLVAVAVVLLLGLWNMLKGGNPGRSQTLMRWRVILQFAAIVVALATYYFTH